MHIFKLKDPASFLIQYIFIGLTIGVNEELPDVMALCMLSLFYIDLVPIVFIEV